MERVPTDADDRLKTDIRITGATIFVNPYKDEEEAERKVAEAERLKVCQSALFLIGHFWALAEHHGKLLYVASECRCLLKAVRQRSNSMGCRLLLMA